jgi:hypothetical protein
MTCAGPGAMALLALPLPAAALRCGPRPLPLWATSSSRSGRPKSQTGSTSGCSQLTGPRLSQAVRPFQSPNAERTPPNHAVERARQAEGHGAPVRDIASVRLGILPDAGGSDTVGDGADVEVELLASVTGAVAASSNRETTRRPR